ncbi:unnamed protein product (macronuclear) [Paramecium tetraurelia]|uniref:Uncharacterized protein n=1 Tax=Paramecium tetraurelia TaxID=5888 RepID=A0E6N9_PARTE|nr:uncharacterized protein GSPATT00003821001 [Paramecium tetraurelia]CAK90956.1 unnamed protein product [Paramecium tetraurelia]|eukprot:XP_001458353.1 hypothetical protein (macronuclear) [Paramecium tetraurelia strain d4-2]
MLSETVIQQTPAKEIIKRMQGLKKKGIFTLENKLIFMMNINKVQKIDQKQELMKIVNQNEDFRIFSFNEEMSKHRENEGIKNDKIISQVIIHRKRGKTFYLFYLLRKQNYRNLFNHFSIILDGLGI